MSVNSSGKVRGKLVKIAVFFGIYGRREVSFGRSDLHGVRFSAPGSSVREYRGVHACVDAVEHRLHFLGEEGRDGGRIIVASIQLISRVVSTAAKKSK